MPRRTTKPLNHPRHYIREWREFRGLTQERLASRIDSTAASISRLEHGLQPYSQSLLESLAQALSCEPGEILRAPPTPDQVDVIQLLERIPPEKRPDAIRILKALAEAA